MPHNLCLINFRPIHPPLCYGTHRGDTKKTGTFEKTPKKLKKSKKKNLLTEIEPLKLAF